MADQDARNQFDGAVEVIKNSPDDIGRWDEIESLAETLNCPDEVANLYKHVLGQDLPRELALELGERGAAFMEEWLGDDPSAVRNLLMRVLEIDPSAEWAFQRLTESFTVAERWPELLALYDRALAATRDQARRTQLLEEAAQVARDIANLPDQAISYLQQLVPLKPDDTQLEHSLERLLERHERWADLIALWESKLPALEAVERDQSRVRIAACWLDNLGEPGKALDAIKPLLADARPENDQDACELLERIVVSNKASVQVRHNALDLLRLHYESTERPREIVRVLEAAIDMSSPEESLALREEAGARLAALDEDVAAMNHYAALLTINPAHTEVQERMFALARRSGEFARYAEGIANAANACADAPRKVALLAESARIRLDMLEDEEGAIKLFQAAMAQEGLPPDEEPRVARRLAELLARADRSQERLGVLERLAAIETTPSTRKTVIGEAARLAEALGETDRALALWQSRIDADADDLFALDAIIALLDSNQRWQPLIESLRLRLSKFDSPSQRRGDMVRIAQIYDQKLDALEQAIAAWTRVQTECGENAETVDALADLFTRTERWQELAELLERASGDEITRVTDRLVRLSDAYRAHLGAPDQALVGYRNALTINSAHEAARTGMTGLLEVDGCSALAASALAETYRENQDWPRFLELLEPRLHNAPDPNDRLRILREAADIQEHKVSDPVAALSSLARALPLAPKDRVLEGHAVRLAESTGQWEVAAEAYREAAQAMSHDPHEGARLRFEQATILENRLDRMEQAHEAFFTVLGIEPGNLRAAQGVIRIGTRLGRWDDVATALLAYVRERDVIEPSLIQEIELVAGQTGAWDSAVQALSSALEHVDLPARLAFELHRTIAVWHRDQRSDLAAAETSFLRALSYEGSRAATLRDLAAIQRQSPGQSFFDTLRRLADADPRDLDVLEEAAAVALEHLSEPADKLTALTTLLARSTAAWRGTSDARGQNEPQVYAGWAIDQLVEHYTAAGNPSAAFDLLVDSARLPFAADTRRAMRYRAAHIASELMRDTSAAIEMYRSVLSQSPDDRDAMQRLATLYETEGRLAENLALKRIQLGMEQDPARRLQLRLEIAALVGEIEKQGGRMEALMTNLEESPGHLPSIEALGVLHVARGAYAELLDVLEDQARKVEQHQDNAHAAVLWMKAANVAEGRTQELDRAIADYRHVVDLTAAAEALQALARLYMDRGQPAMAVPWFENLLASTAPADRPAIVHQLARAHLGAKQTDRAIACLEGNIDDRTPALELRALLAELYRQEENWESLARLLTSSLPMIQDREISVAYAREAADIYTWTLKSPNRALPALETALALLPGDRTLRTQLGIGLRHAGRPEEARDLLNEIVEEFGRRRSPERALVHVELALVHQVLGEEDKALKQMEQASKMDTSNVDIQKRLAGLARQAGDLDKAERTYRSLLLVVRRKPPGEDLDAVGPSEVLFELHKLAEERGQAEQARELLETALETAVQNDVEVRRLRRSLLAHKQAEILLRVIDMRLESSEASAGKADLYADKAEVLHESLGRTEEAVATLIEALKREPKRDDLHKRARALSKQASGIKTYTDAVISIADAMRRKEDPPLVAHLLMRAGEALEYDLEDLRGAMALYQRVEEMDERKAEAYYAIARVAGALGDTGEQARVLEAMLAMATSDEQSIAQVDALYRLAEIFVGNPDRRAQGIDLLEQAFASEPRYGNAGRILKIAAEADPENNRVMTFYERVTRAGSSWEMLLDFLERRAQRSDATPSQVREAVNVAVEHDQNERAEALLSRAVEAARNSDLGVSSAVWALSGLAERRIATGDLTGARDLIQEVADYADPDEVGRLALDLARVARKSDKPLAAEMYGFLRERDPTDRRVWEPLVELYRDLGDSERLQSVIAATLPTLVDPGERNGLRMQHARYLIEELEQNGDAIQVLRDVLLDDPDHIEAAAMLEDVLRKEGDQEGLVDFLWQRFDEARSRGNPDTVADVAARLGSLLDSMGSGDAINVYRQALEVSPASRQLLREVLARLDEYADPRERAQLVERLIAVEEPERAAELAMALCGIYESLQDATGYQRALELGHRVSPESAELHQRLEMWYRDNQLWVELANLMVTDADHLAASPDHHDAAVARLRAAAAVYRDALGDMRGAADMLSRARKLAPTNDALVAELAGCLNSGGDTAGAVAAIGEALDSDIRGSARVDLLLLRSDLRLRLGDEQGAIQDLEDAYAVDPDRVRPQLIGSLNLRRQYAEQRGDREVERASVMRLSDLLAAAGEYEQQRGLLYYWIEREPHDREALYALRDMDKAAENWDGVVSICSRLVSIEQDEEQAQAALDLAEAAELAGRPGDAQPGLEMVHRSQPQNERVRNRLRRIYELSGAHRELAAVLLADGDHAQDEEARYSAYRRAAEVLVYDLSDPAAAIEPARKACELRPDDHGSMLLYVDVLVAGNRTDDAIAILEPAIAGQKRRSPNLAALQQRMARIAAVLGDRDSQLSWLKKAFDVDRKSGEVAAELARLATDMGDYDLALKPLRAITLMENPGPISRVMALLWEAKIEHARGNRAKAELWAKKALREDPDYAEAKEFLEQIGG